MKQSLIILVIVLLAKSSSGDYPNCVDCPEGEVLLYSYLVNTCMSYIFMDNNSYLPVRGQVSCQGHISYSYIPLRVGYHCYYISPRQSRG